MSPAIPLRNLILPIGVLIGFGIGLMLLPGGITGEQEIRPVAPTVGSLAPDFELTDAQGNPVRLSDHRGQPVLLNFWATWCGPCRLEMPAIQERYEAHELTVFAINFDESADQVRQFGEELGLTFPLLLDPGGVIQQLYRVRGYPTSMFLDEEGIVQALHIGIMTESQLDGYLMDVGLEA